ncbi:hypothetical protein SLA2020_281840 [Shorea laevis]
MQEKPYGVWLRADSITRLVGGFAGGRSAGSAASGRAQAGGEGASRPNFGKGVFHGKNPSSTAESAIPLINPNLTGNNPDGNPPKDINVGTITSSTPRW